MAAILSLRLAAAFYATLFAGMAFQADAQMVQGTVLDPMHSPV
jgi:hypothetical protein